MAWGGLLRLVKVWCDFAVVTILDYLSKEHMCDPVRMSEVEKFISWHGDVVY